jgi:hypothetical protein
LKCWVGLTNPGTLAVHDYVVSIGRKDHHIDLQDSEEPYPRTSRPSSITRGFEPFGKKASNSHPLRLFEKFTFSTLAN